MFSTSIPTLLTSISRFRVNLLL